MGMAGKPLFALFSCEITKDKNQISYLSKLPNTALDQKQAINVRYKLC